MSCKSWCSATFSLNDVKCVTAGRINAFRIYCGKWCKMPSKTSRFQASRMQDVQRVKSASINAFRRAEKTRFFFAKFYAMGMTSVLFSDIFRLIHHLKF